MKSTLELIITGLLTTLPFPEDPAPGGASTLPSRAVAQNCRSSYALPESKMCCDRHQVLAPLEGAAEKWPQIK